MNQLQLSIAVLSIAGLYAAWSDIKWRKLPNALCLALAALGLAADCYWGGLALAGSALAHSAIALIAGIGLFALRAIGAGDAKYYAACATWFSLGTGLRLMLWVSLAGLALFFVWFAWRRMRGIKIRTGAADDSDKFPYGIAIAAGSVVSLLVPSITI